MQTQANQEMHGQPSGRRLILQVRWGPMAFRKVLLSPSQVLQVGRAQAMGLSLPHDIEMSNAHFELEWDGSECRLRDLKSTGGTLLGGERVKEAIVQSKDWIRAGLTDFNVYLEDAPPPQPAAGLVAHGQQDHKAMALSLLTAQENLFAVLDAARNSRILDLLQRSSEEYHSLYEGPQGDALADVAPYLVRLSQGSSLLDALLTEGWSEHWGIYLTCASPFRELRRHLRKCLMIHVEGRESRMYFRFYDPRVLQSFLPVCSAEQLNEIFGPINCFFYPSVSSQVFVSSSKTRIHGYDLKTVKTK